MIQGKADRHRTLSREVIWDIFVSLFRPQLYRDATCMEVNNKRLR